MEAPKAPDRRLASTPRQALEHTPPNLFFTIKCPLISIHHLTCRAAKAPNLRLAHNARPTPLLENEPCGATPGFVG